MYINLFVLEARAPQLFDELIEYVKNDQWDIINRKIKTEFKVNMISQSKPALEKEEFMNLLERAKNFIGDKRIYNVGIKIAKETVGESVVNQFQISYSNFWDLVDRPLLIALILLSFILSYITLIKSTSQETKKTQYKLIIVSSFVSLVFQVVMLFLERQLIKKNTLKTRKAKNFFTFISGGAKIVLPLFANIVAISLVLKENISISFKRVLKVFKNKYVMFFFASSFITTVLGALAFIKRERVELS